VDRVHQSRSVDAEPAGVRAALEAAELVVLQEAYADTETAPFADVLLPATSWAEKDGTVTNSERRISRVRAAVSAPGEARHDWQIACDFEGRCAPVNNRGQTRPGTGQVRTWTGPAPVLPRTFGTSIASPHAGATSTSPGSPGRSSSATGRSSGRIRWAPATELRGSMQTGASTRRAGGRASSPDGYRPVAEPVDARYPLRLTTGRLRDQWHGMSRTGTVAASSATHPSRASR
jgi:assimilatory nitrate reductase catalytic subunit